MTFHDNKLSIHKLLQAAFVFCVLLSFPFTVHARFGDHLEVRNIPNANFGVWTAAGNVSTRLPSCISSASDDSPNPSGWFAWQLPYQAKVTSTGGAPDFYLYLDGNTYNSGNRRIGISISHRDVNDGGSFEALRHDIYDTHSHAGSFRNCVRDGDNSELRINISSSELSAKVSGNYTGTFRLAAIGGLWGTNTDSNNFSVSITIQSNPEVMITSLDDIGLGTHAGLGDIYEEENFCVYSSSGSSSYNMHVSSANQDGSGHFFLDGGALGRIPYELHFVDSATGPGSTQVGLNVLSGFGYSGDPYCGGANNATLSVRVREQDMQMAKSGGYSDTLVILVEPQ